MSIFVSTPLFVYAFFARREKRVIAAWLAAIAILIPLLMYYGIGYIQFGYRYASDFYPFLFIPTALELNRRFSRFTPLAIIGCAAINLWGAWVMLMGAFAFS